MNITLENLTKRFPARGRKAQGETVAVKDLSFEIPDGMLVGLLGPSGCGKSTTLNMICGLEAPSEGKIFFGEEEVTHLPPELRGVGMVFQNYALYPHMTVLQNILFPLENLKADVVHRFHMLGILFEKPLVDGEILFQVGDFHQVFVFRHFTPPPC